MNEQQPLTTPRLAPRFGLAEMFAEQKDTVFMASLLYYLGVLTLAGKTASRDAILLGVGK